MSEVVIYPHDSVANGSLSGLKVESWNFFVFTICIFAVWHLFLEYAFDVM